MLFRRFLVPAFLLMLSSPAMAQEIPEAPSGEFQIADHFDDVFQPQLHMNDLAFNYFPKIDKIENDESPKDDNILHSRYKANNCNPDLDPIHCAWQKESEHFRTAGWGIFGAGATLSGVAAILWLTGFWSLMLNDAWEDILSNDENTDKKIKRDEDLLQSAYILWGTGGPLVLTGIIILIVEAVKFRPYRKAQADDQAFQWSPNFVVTPDYQGIGLNMRF